MARHYTTAEKGETLAILDANDGNIKKTSELTGISRKSIRNWRDNKKQILADYKSMQQIQQSEEGEGKSPTEIQTIMDNAEIAENYDKIKQYMVNQFGTITDVASQIALQKISQLSAKDAMWVADKGLDKLLKLKGEPDQVIEVRNVIIHLVIDKLVEAVQEKIITKEQAEKLSHKFDDIEEAEAEIIA